MTGKINVHFEQDEGRQSIDVTISAAKRTEEVEALIERINDPLAGTLPVSDAEGVIAVIHEKDIISIATNGRKLSIKTDSGDYEVRMSMQDAEKRLNPYAFIRISRFEIINLGMVKRFDFSVAGNLRIEMQSGYETWSSRRHIPVIKKRLQGGQWYAE